MTDPLTVQDDTPIAGWYETRLIKGGPYVPIRIRYEGERDEAGDLIEDEILVIEIDGREIAKPWESTIWPYCAKRELSPEQYNYRVADAEHARDHRPNDPKARPREEIDWLEAPIPFGE